MKKKILVVDDDPIIRTLLVKMLRVRDIEVIAVDEARGLVAVSTFEDFPATQQQFVDASGGTYADQASYPRTQHVVELFRFSGGKIEAVQAITSELPYGMRPR